MDIYAVHATRESEVGVIEVLWPTEIEAMRYAKNRSGDKGILCASVTKYRVGELGTREARAWFVGGSQQDPRAVRPGAGRIYPMQVLPGERAEA